MAELRAKISFDDFDLHALFTFNLMQFDFIDTYRENMHARWFRVSFHVKYMLISRHHTIVLMKILTRKICDFTLRHIA